LIDFAYSEQLQRHERCK